ncbi:hypothetical protein SAMN05421505_120113 [Sinosporangium album]|uniref:Uncharacterized protein n=1 Tax=Sinosporangium album TaxID=504805 RepID=A0A1G8EIK1_9ACTN|nr:hypothetical protein [Sinosporangium album]SDH69610.1 hypothetical protein SAMN05421505_120113 [Sinosporangium album]
MTDPNADYLAARHRTEREMRAFRDFFFPPATAPEPHVTDTTKIDTYRERLADALADAWGLHVPLCPHTETIPTGALVDAVLAVPRPGDDPTSLATELRATIADLDAHIEQRAQERAAAMTATVEERLESELDDARTELEEVRERAGADRQRQEDLLAELRRQIDSVVRRNDRLTTVLADLVRAAKPAQDRFRRLLHSSR